MRAAARLPDLSGGATGAQLLLAAACEALGDWCAYANAARAADARAADVNVHGGMTALAEFAALDTCALQACALQVRTDKCCNCGTHFSRKIRVCVIS